MNPHNQLPSNTYEISASATGSNKGPERGEFFAITCSVAGSVTVRGRGVFKYVNIDGASSSEVVKYIDPNTGKAYENAAAATGDPEGFYERISSAETVIPMIAGQTIYGRFTAVKSDGTFTGFAYAG